MIKKMDEVLQTRSVNRAKFRGSQDKMGLVESQPSAARVSLHQRSLTPVFVDTQLSSATSPSTPPRAHPLTLHEYRKKQQAPSPPPTGAGKRVKRKVATPDLTAVERVAARQPLSPSPASDHSFELSPSPWPSERVNGPATTGFDPPEALRSKDSVPSFTSLLDSYCDRSNSAPPLSSNLGGQAKSIFSGESFVSPVKRRVRHFKPAKRLPRPSTHRAARFSHESITPSPLRLASSRHTNHLNSPLQSNNHFSSFAVSKISFPRPPSPPRVSSPQDRVESAIASDPPKASKTEQQVRNSTTLHFRGASFDVVNPHHSLDLQDIETPADHDADLNDYFEIKPEPVGASHSHKRNTPSNRTMESGQTFRTANESSSPGSNSGFRRLMTPPRTVYDDLTSAHLAITSRGGLSSPEKSSRLEFLLPPPPVMVSPHKSLRMEMSDSSINLSICRPEPLNVQKTHDSPSVLRRVTSIFRRGKQIEDEESKGSISGSQSNALLDQRPASPPRRAPSIHLQWFQKLGRDKRTSRSAPYFSGPQSRGVETSGQLPRYSFSQPEVRHSAYVSNYPDTEADDSRIFDTDSVAPDWSSPDLDYSQEVHDQSDLWQFADKSGNEPQRMSFLREGTTASILDRYTQNDITLDSIVGDYYNEAPPGSAPSLTTLSTAGEEHDSSPVIERGRGGGGARPINSASSGLSQFDFGIRHSNSGTDSSEDEPQQTSSRLSGLRSLRTSAGGPPSEPLPFLPDPDLRPPNPPFMQRGRSTTTATGISYGSSYGDTRNLLLMSPSSQSGGDVTFQSKLGSLLPIESAKASSVTLPATGQEQDLGSNNIDLEDSPYLQYPAEIVKRRHGRQASLEQAMNNELQRRSRLSGLSSLSGSLFVMKNANRQNPWPCEDAQTSTSYHSFATPPNRSEAIPKMWQEQSPTSHSRQSNINEGSNHQPSSSTETATTEDRDDWETVGDVSRGDIAVDDLEEPDDRSDSPWHSLHKPNASILKPSYDFRGGVGFPRHNALTPVRTPPSHQRPSPLGSHPHPFNTPPPDLGSSFSSKNKWNNINDVDMAESSVEERRDEGQNNQDADQVEGSIDNNNRKQQHFSMTTTTFDVIPPTAHSPTIHSSTTHGPKLSTEPSSDIEYDRGWVPYPSPRPKNPKLFTNTSLSTILSSTRETPDRASSSTAPSVGTNPKRVNLFAKFTVTGPKSNLTGTPQGTGMREVGSSEADNSSPGIRFSSSPLSPKLNRSFHPVDEDHPELAEYDEKDYATPDSSPPNSAGLPIDLLPKQPDLAASISRDRILVSPLESRRSRQHVEADSFSSSSISSLETSDSIRANEGRPRRYGHLHSPSQKWAPLYTNYRRPSADEMSQTRHQRKGSRRSVYGQKELMPMKLSTIPQTRAEVKSPEKLFRRDEPGQWSKFTSPSPHPTDIRPNSGSVMGSIRTDAPLLTRPSHHYTVRDRPSITDTPSLKPIPPSPSMLAERRLRERLISQIVFAILIFFPPGLVMYGFGFMDPLMAATTKGEILGFGAKEKRVARYVGITMTVAIVVGIAVCMVSLEVKR